MPRHFLIYPMANRAYILGNQKDKLFHSLPSKLREGREKPSQEKKSCRKKGMKGQGNKRKLYFGRERKESMEGLMR